MDNTVDIKAFKKEQKRRERSEARKSKIRDFECWFYNNKELACIIVPAAIAGTGILLKGGIQITKKVIDNCAVNKQMKLDSMRCYDRSAGHFWYFKRKLTNNDWIQINARKANGESLEQILRSMNILK